MWLGQLELVVVVRRWERLVGVRVGKSVVCCFLG